jgi:hypothetical protein
MKKALKIGAVALAVLFVIAQFIRPDYSEPPIVPEQELAATTEVPGNVSAIFERSCNDCHTSKTTYPWYSQITPVSWWLKNHIDEGRHELNMSEWGTYSDSKKSKKLEEICEQVETREMPLPSYTWVHRDSFLSENDIRTLCDWSKAERAKIPATQ